MSSYGCVATPSSSAYRAVSAEKRPRTVRRCGARPLQIPGECPSALQVVPNAQLVASGLIQEVAISRRSNRIRRRRRHAHEATLL
eukprot:scaffold3382_cov108-Isochrysis_galbana.AAC.6